MEPNGRRACDLAQGRPLAFRFLHAVFSKAVVSGLDKGGDGVDGQGFAHGHKFDAFGVALGASGRRFDLTTQGAQGFGGALPGLDRRTHRLKRKCITSPSCTR